MKHVIFVFLCVLCVSVNVKAELNENCQVKNDYVGKCISIETCNYYQSMLRNPKSFGLDIFEVFDILRSVNCGYNHKDSLVCCPMNLDTDNQGVSSPQHNNSESGDSGLISQSTNPASTDAPNNTPAPTTQLPVSSSTVANTISTVPSTEISTEPSETTYPSTTQSYETTTPTGKTTPVAPQTTTESSTGPAIDHEKFKILPEECGRVLTFKYFHGNRTEFDDFPWTTLVEYETPTGKQLGCGGALIHNRYVLTAAHCVSNLSPSWKVSRVRFGEYDTETEIDCLPDGPNITMCNEKPIDVAVEQVIVHSEFKPNDPSRLHDIALLRLSESVKFTGVVKPICLPTKFPFPQRYYTTGWGKDLHKGTLKNGTNLKYMSYVSLDDQKACKKVHSKNGVKISQSHLCGGAKPTEKSCIGDNGGPLMGLEEIPNLEKRVVAFGVLSINKPGMDVCQSGSPSVYTKVLDYMNWILDNLKE